MHLHRAPGSTGLWRPDTSPTPIPLILTSISVPCYAYPATMLFVGHVREPPGTLAYPRAHVYSSPARVAPGENPVPTKLRTRVEPGSRSPENTYIVAARGS